MSYNKEEFFISGDSRKRRICILGSIIVLLVIISIYSFALHVKNNKDMVVTYDEESSLDYKVYLKENDFFGDKYLEKDKQYIASLIDYIDATFNYDLTLTNKSSNYDYSYRIEAEVNVSNPENNNSLYKSTELLVDTKKGVGQGKKTTNINEKIKIDYNKYNDLISKFIETYELSNLDSTLSVNMYVDFDGDCGVNQKENKNSVIKLVIPLTRKTVAIDMSSDVTNTTDNYIKCGKKDSYVYLIFGLITCGVAIGLVFELFNYLEDSKSPLEVYNSKLKKIMNNYGSFIQKINNNYDMSKSQILKVESFDDMLEIRDTLQAPILMLENKDKYGVFFIIPTAYNVLYTYALRVEDIKIDMINDVIEEPIEVKKPSKEYTNEYITKQLTMVTNSPIQKENTIEGTKESDEDLYSQIEKTQEFRLNLTDEDLSDLFSKIENTDVAAVKKKRKKRSKKSSAAKKATTTTKETASEKKEEKKEEPKKAAVKIVAKKETATKTVAKKEAAPVVKATKTVTKKETATAEKTTKRKSGRRKKK